MEFNPSGTTVVRIRRKDGVLVQDCDIYIGRRMYQGGHRLPGSKWANPYKIKEYSMEDCLSLYENHVRNSSLYNQLEELIGARLGCWCDYPGPSKVSSKGEFCHGHVLIRLLNEKIRSTYYRY